MAITARIPPGVTTTDQTITSANSWEHTLTIPFTTSPALVAGDLLFIFHTTEAVETDANGVAIAPIQLHGSGSTLLNGGIHPNSHFIENVTDAGVDNSFTGETGVSDTDTRWIELGYSAGGYDGGGSPGRNSAGCWAKVVTAEDLQGSPTDIDITVTIDDATDVPGSSPGRNCKIRAVVVSGASTSVDDLLTMQNIALSTMACTRSSASQGAGYTVGEWLGPNAEGQAGTEPQNVLKQTSESVTGTVVSFSTLSGVTGVIASSDLGVVDLSVFLEGDVISVAGSAANSRNYYVTTESATAMTVEAFPGQDAVTTESAGPSITIKSTGYNVTDLSDNFLTLFYGTIPPQGFAPIPDETTGIGTGAIPITTNVDPWRPTATPGGQFTTNGDHVEFQYWSLQADQADFASFFTSWNGTTDAAGPNNRFGMRFGQPTLGGGFTLGNIWSYQTQLIMVKEAIEDTSVSSAATAADSVAITVSLANASTVTATDSSAIQPSLANASSATATDSAQPIISTSIAVSSTATATTGDVLLAGVLDSTSSATATDEPALEVVLEVSSTVTTTDAPSTGENVVEGVSSSVTASSVVGSLDIVLEISSSVTATDEAIPSGAQTENVSSSATSTDSSGIAVSLASASSSVSSDATELQIVTEVASSVTSTSSASSLDIVLEVSSSVTATDSVVAGGSTEEDVASSATATDAPHLTVVLQQSSTATATDQSQIGDLEDPSSTATATDTLAIQVSISTSSTGSASDSSVDAISIAVSSSVTVTDTANPIGPVSHSITVTIPGIGSVFSDLLTEAQAMAVIDIWNTALTSLGITAVTSVTDGSPQQLLLTNIYPLFRKQFLADHLWNGAKKTKALTTLKDDAGDAVSPPSRWTNAFALPDDVLRVWRLNGLENRPDYVGGFTTNMWEIEVVVSDEGEAEEALTRALCTDESTATIEYVFDVGDKVTLLGPLTQHALGRALAVYVAHNFGKNATEIAQLEALAKEALLAAKGVDGQEGSPQIMSPTSLLGVRYI